MRRKLTSEQRRVFVDYYLDRAKLLVGQLLLVTFGLVMPMLHGLRVIRLPIPLYLIGACIGLILILSTRANKQAS